MSVAEHFFDLKNVDKRGEILKSAGLSLAYSFDNKDRIECVIDNNLLSEMGFLGKSPDQSNHYYFFPFEGFTKDKSLAYWELEQKRDRSEVMISINDELRSDVAIAYVLARVSFIPRVKKVRIAKHSFV